MPSLEETFETACSERLIPGAVLIATDRTGKFQYAKAFGTRSLREEEPLRLDEMMWIASCTKLLTTIAVMQCVERGQLKLDDDITAVLPEFKDIDILIGFDASEKPMLKKATRTMTMRHLLTHSSGIAYDFFNETIQKWRKSQGQPLGMGKSMAERNLFPLLFEPGTSWEYSPAIDWAGKAVERLNNNVSLEEYFVTHIFKPLGIRDITFFIDRKPELLPRLCKMSMRDPSGSGMVVYTDTTVYRFGEEECMGGGGLYASPVEYIKVLHSILRDDGVLLKSETIDDMFKPHLTRESQQAMMKVLENKDMNNILGGGPQGARRDWGLGGMLYLDAQADWRLKNTMSWSGLPNLIWFIDREAGLCGLYSSQVIPTGDPKSIEMSQIFERAMYERSGRAIPHM